MKALGIIPARYASTRFPGKPLHPIAGKPLIQHVVERCKRARSLSEVIVATDDARIRDVVRRFCRVEMTRPDHPSGSDRIAEVAVRGACDAVVNIQGDEPLIDPGVIDAVVAALADHEMSTAATIIKAPAECNDPNVVKVVVNSAGQALYFSRRTIPYLRDAASGSIAEQLAAFPFLKHLGVYGYRRETLLRLVNYPVSPLEAAEKRHAGDAARFVAERGRAAAGELRQLVAVRRDQRFVRRHHRDAAIQRAAHQRKRGLDAAQRLDDDVDRLGEERLDVVGDARDVRRRRARARRAPHERGGDDRREAARRQRRGVLARVAREGGADIAEAQQANPARGREAVCKAIRDGCGIRRSVEHGRSHDERSAGEKSPPRC